MAKLEYFKFDVMAWLTGSIQLLSPEEKGTFVDICAMIWQNGGRLELDKKTHRKLRLDDATLCDRIRAYTELDILVCDRNILSVKFINKQLSDLEETSKKNRENAKKRWSGMRPNANKKRREEKRIIHDVPNGTLSGKPDGTTSETSGIVDYLNGKAGTAFRKSSKSTMRHIGARLGEGFAMDDFRLVVDHKVGEWLDDPKMRKFLRPETLFGPKFEGYLNDAKLAEKQR